MSTRGVIAIEQQDKSCRAIPVQYDMYLDGGGRTLIDHYTTPERVKQLLALGSLAVLGGKLSADDPESNATQICEAYHRDLHERLRGASLWASAEELVDCAKEFFWAEYVYLFRNGEWYFDTPYKKQGWHSVKQILEAINAN